MPQNRLKSTVFRQKRAIYGLKTHILMQIYVKVGEYLLMKPHQQPTKMQLLSLKMASKALKLVYSGVISLKSGRATDKIIQKAGEIPNAVGNILQ